MPADFDVNPPLAKLEELKNEPEPDPNYGSSPISIISDVSALTNKDGSQQWGTPNCRLCALGIKGHSYVAAIEIENGKQHSPPRNEPKMEPKIERLSISEFDKVVRVQEQREGESIECRLSTAEKRREYHKVRNRKIQQKKEAKCMMKQKYNLSLTEEEKQKLRDNARMRIAELNRATACVPENIITGKRTRKGTENIKTHCLSLLEQEQVDGARKNSIRKKNKLKAMTEEEKTRKKETGRKQQAERRRRLHPEEVAVINEKKRIKAAESRQRLRPEEIAVKNEKQRVSSAKWRQRLLPEQKAEVNEKQRQRAAKWRQRLLPEELAVIKEKQRISTAKWAQKLLREQPIELRERKAAEASKCREKRNAARRENMRLMKLEEPEKYREINRRKR